MGYTVIPYEKLSKMACSKGNMTMNTHKPYSDLGIPYFLSNPHRYGKPIGVPGTESTRKYFSYQFSFTQWIGLRENLQENPIFNGKIWFQTFFYVP